MWQVNLLEHRFTLRKCEEAAQQKNQEQKWN